MKKVFLSLIVFSTSLSAQSASWYSYKDSVNNFCVQFPEKPLVEAKTIGGEGTNINQSFIFLDYYETGDKSNLYYGIIINEYPAALMNNDSPYFSMGFYKYSIDGMVNSVNGKILSDKEISFNNITGHDVKIELDEGALIMNCRFLLIKSRLYVIGARTKAAQDNNEDIKTFIDSFKMLK